MDTSAVIKFLSYGLPSAGTAFIENFIDSDCTISFISEIELQAWAPANPSNAIIYQQFVAKAVIINIDAAIIAETIAVRKNYRLKIPDAIIAATAILAGRTLVGDNDKDFGKIPNLNYVNPRTL